MSEQERIMEHMLENRGFGALVERSHYRATGPTRSLVHNIAGAWGMRARTSMERVGDRYLLWYKLVPR